MNCEDFQDNYLADPNSDDLKMQKHKASCAECQDFSDMADELEVKIKEAMHVSFPNRLVAKIMQFTSEYSGKAKR